jgi:hypothetical protein
MVQVIYEGWCYLLAPPPLTISNILLTVLQTLYRREGAVAARAGSPSLDTARIQSELSQLLEAAQYLKLS